MKIVQINSVCESGSTGKICVSISKLLSEKGIENYILYTTNKSDYSLGFKYMNLFEVKFQAIKSRILGNYGFNSKRATKRLLGKLDEISPDIVHLHNLHSHNVHLGDLFEYLKKKKIKIFWTFHDCWAFTAYCSHYEMIDCNQWNCGGCKNCPEKKKKSWFFDRSRYLFEKKKQLFEGLDLTIITPSKWLANQVTNSFLRKYKVIVINNGIDLSVFYPRESDFRHKYQINDKFIVLGVAFDWGTKKGIDVFIELSKRLDDSYQIVLVGTNKKIDKQIPKNVLTIHRTQNQNQLAEIYTAADVFVNPTKEDTFPTTHIEALACGTPVIAFDVGGCFEMLNENCGEVVEKNNVDAIENRIISLKYSKVYPAENCVLRASEFCANEKYEEYVALYTKG